MTIHVHQPPSPPAIDYDDETDRLLVLPFLAILEAWMNARGKRVRSRNRNHTWPVSAPEPTYPLPRPLLTRTTSMPNLHQLAEVVYSPPPPASTPPHLWSLGVDGDPAPVETTPEPPGPVLQSIAAVLRRRGESDPVPEVTSTHPTFELRVEPPTPDVWQLPLPSEPTPPPSEPTPEEDNNNPQPAPRPDDASTLPLPPPLSLRPIPPHYPLCDKWPSCGNILRPPLTSHLMELPPMVPAHIYRLLHWEMERGHLSTSCLCTQQGMLVYRAHEACRGCRAKGHNCHLTHVRLDAAQRHILKNKLCCVECRANGESCTFDAPKAGDKVVRTVYEVSWPSWYRHP